MSSTGFLTREADLGYYKCCRILTAVFSAAIRGFMMNGHSAPEDEEPYAGEFTIVNLY